MAVARTVGPLGWRGEFAVVSAVSCGGALGAMARYGIGVALPHGVGGFAWSTLLVNALGCLLIGVLMATVAVLRRPRPLLRPFLGVGVLGGFTTFSTYVVDVQQSVAVGAVGTALLYLVVTVVVALACAWAGEAAVIRVIVRRRRPAGDRLVPPEGELVSGGSGAVRGSG